MLKAVVIGLGAMGQNHARVLQELLDVELVGISDLDESAAARVGHRFHVPFDIDYRSLLDRCQPDMAIIAVPTEAHLDVASDAINRGIHVLVEKPLASTVEQAQKLIQIAREANVRLATGHIERFNPAVVEMKKRLAEGQAGEVFRLHSRRLGPFPARVRDVGVVVDLATHDLDMLRYVLNCEVSRVYAEMANVINSDREDSVDCVIRCQNHVVATLNVNWTTPTKIRELTITGTQGMFLVNYLTQDLFFYENGQVAQGEWYPLSVLTGVGEGNITQIKLTRIEPLKAEIGDFVSAVLHDREPLVTGQDSIAALRLAEALLRSNREQRVVNMSEVLEIEASRV